MAPQGVPREPYAAADEYLRALAGQAEGFGSGTIGGVEGPVYSVTTLEDSGPGSLRDACNAKGPLWITFALSGTILLSSGPIRVRSHKTIDGRGQKVLLSGGGLHLKECCHVIICNLMLAGGRGPDADGIQIKPNSRHIWVDRCTLEDYDDGLIDITRGSTDLTVSRCHFRRHDKTMLVGANPGHTMDRDIRVTVHHCFFDGTRQRHPRVRYGKAHLYNNFTRGWEVYGVCASVESQILSQKCVYEAAGKKLKAFEYYFEQAPDGKEKETGCLRSEQDTLLNGATGEERNASDVFDPSSLYSCDWSLQDCPTSVIMANSGWQDVPFPKS